MSHIKSLTKPKPFVHISRKWRWTVSPSPGPHPKEKCIPLLMIIRDALKFAMTSKEAKKILKEGKVKIDCRVVKEHNYPVGLFDVISIESINKYYRLVPSQDVLSVVEIGKKEADRKLCRIENKTMVRGKKLQLNLHDGKNILIDKDSYSTFDSLLISLPSLEIIDHVKKEKSLSILIGGKNIGLQGVWETEAVTKGSMRNLVSVKLEGREIQVPKDKVFPVGKDKPLITVNS